MEVRGSKTSDAPCRLIQVFNHSREVELYYNWHADGSLDQMLQLVDSLLYIPWHHPQLRLLEWSFHLAVRLVRLAAVGDEGDVDEGQNSAACQIGRADAHARTFVAGGSGVDVAEFQTDAASFAGVFVVAAAAVVGDDTDGAPRCLEVQEGDLRVLAEAVGRSVDGSRPRRRKLQHEEGDGGSGANRPHSE